MKILFYFAVTLILSLNCINASAVTHTAKSAVLIEMQTGEIIYQKNAHERLPMASTTKIMTALCAIESGMLYDTVKIDDRAVGIEGSSIYLQKGESMKLIDLCYGLMLNSGNDSACAIAYKVSGSIEKFVELMNKKANELGLENTHFDNPSGLDGKTHYTTAYELAKLTRYALGNSIFAKIVSAKTAQIPNTNKKYNRFLKNHNKLLNMYEGCTGVKTGFTRKSGRCLVSSAQRDGMELICVTLSDPDDWNSHINMFNYGFKNFGLYTPIKKGSYLATVCAGDDLKNTVKLYAEDDADFLVKKGENSSFKVVYNLDYKIKPPLKYGDICGNVEITSGGKTKVINAVCTTTLNKKEKFDFFALYKVLLKEFFLKNKGF